MTKEWTLIKEGKNRSSWWVKGRVVFSAVMEELNSGKSPYVTVFIDSWAVGYGLAMWSHKKEMETRPIKGKPM